MTDNNNNNNQQTSIKMGYGGSSMINATNTKFDQCKRRFYAKLKPKLWLFAYIGAIFNILLCVIPYIMSAIIFKKVYPVWPFVSDGGAAMPAANFFSQLLDTTVFFFLVSSWARYKQVNYYISNLLPNSTDKEVNNGKMINKLKKKNYRGLIYTFLAACGMVIVGNFRSTERIFIHSAGAGAVFFFISLFTYNQCYICFKLAKCGIESRPITMTINLVVSIINILLAGVFLFLSFFSKDVNFLDHQHRLNWRPEEDGYLNHVLSAVFEWLFILSLAPLFFMIGRRMRKFRDWDKVAF